MFIDAVVRAGGNKLSGTREISERVLDGLISDTFQARVETRLETDARRWKQAFQSFKAEQPPRLGEGFNEQEKDKLTPQKLSEMSREQLTAVNRDTLFDLHLQFGRELFNETNLAGDRDYGSKNQQRSDYTDTLARIINIHGTSPVGQEAAAMLCDCLHKMDTVEQELLPKKGSSKVADHYKYGFRGGRELFGYLGRNPAAVAGSDDILEFMMDNELHTT